MIRLAEIIEKETEAYYKMDPDPFDDRHPGKPVGPVLVYKYRSASIPSTVEQMTYVVQNQYRDCL